MAARKDPAREIRAQTQQVTLLGLKRLEALLSDPDASNADVPRACRCSLSACANIRARRAAR